MRRAYIYYMTAQKQFYDEDRARKGIKRDVRDVVGELQRIRKKEECGNEPEHKRSTRIRTSHNAHLNTVPTLNIPVLRPKRSAAKKANEIISKSIIPEVNNLKKIPENNFEKDSPQPKKAKLLKNPPVSNTYQDQQQSVKDIPVNFTERLNSVEKYICKEQEERNNIVIEMTKALEKSNELIALMLEAKKSKDTMSLKNEEPIEVCRSTPPLTFGSNQIDQTTSGMNYLTKVKDPLETLINSNKIQMSSREFYFYNALQEKQAAERVRQLERDMAERSNWLHMMYNN